MCSCCIPRGPLAGPNFHTFMFEFILLKNFRANIPDLVWGRQDYIFLAIVFLWQVLVASRSSAVWTCCSRITLTYSCQISVSTPLPVLLREFGCLQTWAKTNQKKTEHTFPQDLKRLQRFYWIFLWYIQHSSDKADFTLLLSWGWLVKKACATQTQGAT